MSYNTMNKNIANFIGYVYIPHNTKGEFKKAGWYIKSKKPRWLKDGKNIYHLKRIGNDTDFYYGYVCRNHNDLGFHLIQNVGCVFKLMENIDHILINGVKFYVEYTLSKTKDVNGAGCNLVSESGRILFLNPNIKKSNEVAENAYLCLNSIAEKALELQAEVVWK